MNGEHANLSHIEEASECGGQIEFSYYRHRKCESFGLNSAFSYTNDGSELLEANILRVAAERVLGIGYCVLGIGY